MLMTTLILRCIVLHGFCIVVMLSTVRLSPTRINGDDEVEGSEEAVDLGSVDSQVPAAVAVNKGKKGRRKKDDDWYVGNLYFKLASIISHLFRYFNFIFSQSVHSFNHSTSVHDKTIIIIIMAEMAVV